jgi:hypothetical protein
MDRLIVVRNKFKLHLTRKYLTRPEMLMLYSGSTVVEHSIHNPKVGGSNPAKNTDRKKWQRKFYIIGPCWWVFTMATADNGLDKD